MESRTLERLEESSDSEGEPLKFAIRTTNYFGPLASSIEDLETELLNIWPSPEKLNDFSQLKTYFSVRTIEWSVEDDQLSAVRFSLSNGE